MRRERKSYEENKCVVEEEITRMITERLLEAKKSEETSKFGKMKTFIEQKHSDNLKVFEEKEEIKKMKQSEEEERLLVEEEKQRRIMEIRAATVKKTAEEFRKKKEEERLTQKQKEEDELALVENIKKEAIREQLPIIRGRQAEAETKFIHNYQVKYVKKLEALIRKDELDRIAENLPERPVAERDVARLVQETETVKRKFAKEEKVEEV